MELESTIIPLVKAVVCFVSRMFYSVPNFVGGFVMPKTVF